MKTTHTIPDVEGLILEKLDKLRDSKDRVEQRKLRAEIIRLEKHHRDCNDKYINGHKYPERMKGFPDDKPMNKTELNKLIDSVESVDYNGPEYEPGRKYYANEINNRLNLNGVFVTDPTNKDYDSGWEEPKTMKPDHFFK